ncbi:MAG TPA: VOC family protein [Thermoanaerobaculia bacterium]|jgi:predicted enzyme related to lactoylglutathione lyase|nr:VOC family protein [Thermoanaerobaculia bacterium]
MKMNSVVHFEFPVDDRTRAAKFYETTFGWHPTMLGPEMGEYVIVTTTETDDKGPLKPGAINGGLFLRTDPSQVPSVVIDVDDVRESMKKVEEAGGKVLGGQTPGEPDDIPGIGLYAAFIDTEGNRVGMLQSTRNMDR